MAMEKTFNPETAEPRIYADWERISAFKAGANARDGASSYAIMIPPPNVTGVLHMGHAFNNTLQDILMRWKRMQGFDTLWQAGTDHAGIATQMVVERMLAETQQPGRRELGREAFLAKVWEWKEQSGGTIVQQLKRLGASCDWDRTAFTMAGAQGDTRVGHENSPNFHDAVIKVFVEMYNKGLIYRGKRLVNWDPHFETAISDLEVENVETPGHMWHFKYPLADGATYTYVEKDADGNVVLEELRDYISIATTRPETMLGDGAVAVHPSDERYAPIVGKLCEIPVGPKEHRRLIPIITDEYPDKDFGSGAVKITGAHDFNDYQVAKRGGIPMYRLMDTRGAMRDDGAPYAEEAAKAQAHAKGAEFTENGVDAINLIPDDLRGLDRFEARARVVDQITSEGLAVMQTVTRDVDGEEVSETIPMVEDKPIMQPFGDRSKVVIEPMLTDQWFVDTDKIVQPALDAVNNGQIKIMPEREKKVWDHWLENIEPWCISRQLWWGHQIPVWYTLDFQALEAKVGGNTFDATESQTTKLSEFLKAPHLAKICAANETKAVAEITTSQDDVWHPFNTGQAKVFQTQQEAMTAFEVGLSKGELIIPIWRDPDVLDTWFSSGLWPIGTLGWPEDTEELQKYFPTSDLITGTDILFFWVARMVMMQLAVLPEDSPVEDRIPFKNVYLHGLVRDAKGKKMSKSTGNVVDPLELIDEFGADALRFSSAAMAAMGGVLKLDKQRIEGYRNFGTKLWNAGSYGEFKGVFDVPHSNAIPDTTHPLNNWIKGEIAKTLETVDAALTAYRFNDAAATLYAFVWNTFCSQYLEFTKPVFDDPDPAVVAEAKATYAWAYDQCLIMLHPFMPFITEELWSQKSRPNMLVHQDWPTYSAADLVDPQADADMNWTVAMIDAIRSVRAQMNVPGGAIVDLVVADMDASAKSAWAIGEVLIKRMARVASLTEVDDLAKGTGALAVAGGRFGLPLADLIDLDAERTRLEKNLGKLEKEIGGLNGRLKNPKFVASAPDEVVTEAKANLAAREDEAGKLRAALAQLT